MLALGAHPCVLPAVIPATWQACLLSSAELAALVVMGGLYTLPYMGSPGMFREYQLKYFTLLPPWPSDLTANSG